MPYRCNMFVSEYQHQMNKYIHAHLKTVFGIYSGADLGFAGGGGWGTTTYYYRPQRSCGQGYVFTRVCDSVHRGGGGSPCPGGWGRENAPGPGRPPSPPDQATPPREADSRIRSTSGRYASYWNAFLFGQIFPKTARKWTKLDRGGASKIILSRSATVTFIHSGVITQKTKTSLQATTSAEFEPCIHL